MGFLNEISEYLSNNDFSIEMLNFCRNCFQYGGWGDEESDTFKKMMVEKVKNIFPNDYLKIGEILADLCMDRGILEIKDVLFIGDAIFAEKKENFRANELLHIDFIGSTGNFHYSDSTSFVFPLVHGNIKPEIRDKFAREMHNLFEEYFDISLFPKVLNGMQAVSYYSFAINCNEEEICKSCEENKEINFTITCRVNNTNCLRSVDVSYSPNKENVLEVANCNDDIIRLSEILNPESPKKLINKDNTMN